MQYEKYRNERAPDSDIAIIVLDLVKSMMEAREMPLQPNRVQFYVSMGIAHYRRCKGDCKAIAEIITWQMNLAPAVAPVKSKSKGKSAPPKKPIGNFRRDCTFHYN